MRCQRCGQADADRLLYWRRYYMEIGRYAIVDPELVCLACVPEHTLIYAPLSLVNLPFPALGRMTGKAFAALVNRKGYEFNALAVEYWEEVLGDIKAAHEKTPDNPETAA